MMLLLVIGLLQANAETFKYKNGMVIVATDYKTASKRCFNLLTNGKYPGEERGLDIIDLCANPIK